METSIQEQADAGIEVVNARLNYLAEATPKPVNYAYDPLQPEFPRRSGKYVERSVSVHRVTAANYSIISRSTPTVSFSQSTKLRSRISTIPMRSSRSTTPRSSA